MTMAYLRKELQRLAATNRTLLPQTPQTPQRRREFGGDVLEQHMALMAQAAQRVQDMKRFVWDSLNSVPEPILVSDVRGIVLIANHAAKAHFARLGAPMPEGRAMQAVLGGLTLVKAIDSGAASDADQTLFARAHWPALLDPARSEFAALMAQGVEVRDADERDHLLRYANCTNAQGETTGWIAGLVDVSRCTQLERQREDALRLLSHDMRSPQASILALVEMERARETPALARGVLERIERYAQRALTLADDFRAARARRIANLHAGAGESRRADDRRERRSLAAGAREAHRARYGNGQRNRPQRPRRERQRRRPLDLRGPFADDARARQHPEQRGQKYSPPDTRIACELSCPVKSAGVSCTIRDRGLWHSRGTAGRLVRALQAIP